MTPNGIDCPKTEDPKPSITAVAKDGIQLMAKARVTVRTNIERLVGGATEETIIARVGEGIVATSGSAETHKSARETPDLSAEGGPGKGRGGARLSTGEWERRGGMRLRLIYRRKDPSLLVAEKARINTRGTAVASRSKTGRGQVSAPIFLLVPQVKLRKRLDLTRDAQRVAGSVPGLIVEKWRD